MSSEADPWPEEFAETIVKPLTRHFDARHDEHTRLNREIVRQHEELISRLDEAAKRIDDLGHLLMETQRGATFTQMLAQQVWAKVFEGAPMPQPPPPGPNAPRPKAIDDACAIPAGDPAQEVRLPRYGMVLVPEPESDPEKIWAHVQSSNAEGGARGVRHSTRTRGR